MDRKESNLYLKFMVIVAVWIIAVVWVMTIPADASDLPKKAVFTDSASEGNKDIVEDQKIDLRAVFDDSTGSGMPCENREQFERWYETYEQEAEEEDGLPVSMATIEDTHGKDHEDDGETASPMRDAVETPVETIPSECPIYAIGGETIPEYLQEYLHSALERHGIGYWYEIGLCQIFQESRGNAFAQNPNGQDKGILQYRIGFWDWSRGDIFSPEAQINLYAEQMAWRLNQGLSADECISRHNTSDYSPAVNWEYVGQVKQHLKNMREVK